MSQRRALCGFVEEAAWARSTPYNQKRNRVCVVAVVGRFELCRVPVAESILASFFLPSRVVSPAVALLPQPIAASVPMYVSGSADLHGSNKNYIAGGGDFGVNLGKRCVLLALVWLS